jgi:O-antigen/teichoic acid export membrane protein
MEIACRGFVQVRHRISINTASTRHQLLDTLHDIIQPPKTPSPVCEQNLMATSASKLEPRDRGMIQPSRTPLKSVSVLFMAMIAVNVFSQLNNLVLGRVLGPEAYSAYAAFTALFMILTLLPSAWQQVSARFAASDPEALPDVSSLAFGSSLPVMLILLLVSPWLAAALKLPVLWLIGLALVTPAYVLLGERRGVFQAANASRLGTNLVLEHVVKISLTVVLWLIIPGQNAAVLALLVALISAFALTGKTQLEHVFPVARHAEIERFSLAALTVALAQAALQNADVLLARALIAPTDAGVYAAVAMVGRAIVAASWAIGAAAFPLVARRASSGESHAPLLWQAVAAVAFIGGGVTVLCAIAPSQIIGLLVGVKYMTGSSWIALYGLAATFTAVSGAVTNHLMALGKRGVIALPIFGALLQIGWISLQHQSPLEMARAQCSAMFVLCVLSIAVALFETWINRTTERGPNVI